MLHIKVHRIGHVNRLGLCSTLLLRLPSAVCLVPGAFIPARNAFLYDLVVVQSVKSVFSVSLSKQAP